MGQFDEIITQFNENVWPNLYGFNCEEKSDITFQHKEKKQNGIILTWTMPSDTYGSTLANNLSKVFSSIFGTFYVSAY